MRRPSGQFAIVLVILFVVEAVGVNTLAGWHAGPCRRRWPRRSAVLDYLVDVVINVLDVVEIAWDSGLGSPFLGLATATAAPTAASTASTTLVIALTGLGLAPCVRGKRPFVGRFGFVVELGIELAPQIGAGTGFVEFKLTIGGCKFISLSRRRGARFAWRRSFTAALARTRSSATSTPASSASPLTGLGSRFGRALALPRQFRFDDIGRLVVENRLDLLVGLNDLDIPRLVIPVDRLGCFASSRLDRRTALFVVSPRRTVASSVIAATYRFSTSITTATLGTAAVTTATTGATSTASFTTTSFAASLAAATARLPTSFAPTTTFARLGAPRRCGLRICGVRLGGFDGTLATAPLGKSLAN